LPVLAEKFRVTAYDLRGHGYSDQPVSGYTSDDMIKDLKGLMDHLKIDCAFFIGHSFGGTVALHFSAKYPHRSASTVILDAEVPSLMHLRQLKNWKGWELYKAELDRLDIHTEEELMDVEYSMRKSLFVPIHFGFRLGASRQSDRLVHLIEKTSALKEFRLVRFLTEEQISLSSNPTLCMYGSFSPLRPIGERLQEIMPNCELTVIPDHGHFFLLQSPHLVLELLDTYLKRRKSKPDDHLPTVRLAGSERLIQYPSPSSRVSFGSSSSYLLPKRKIALIEPFDKEG